MSVMMPATFIDQTLCTRILAIPIDIEIYPAMNTNPGFSRTDFIYQRITSRLMRNNILKIKKDTPQNCAKNAVVIRKT